MRFRCAKRRPAGLGAHAGRRRRAVFRGRGFRRRVRGGASKGHRGAKRPNKRSPELGPPRGRARRTAARARRIAAAEAGAADAEAEPAQGVASCGQRLRPAGHFRLLRRRVGGADAPPRVAAHRRAASAQAPGLLCGRGVSNGRQVPKTRRGRRPAGKACLHAHGAGPRGGRGAGFRVFRRAAARRKRSRAATNRSTDRFAGEPRRGHCACARAAARPHARATGAAEAVVPRRGQASFFPFGRLGLRRLGGARAAAARRVGVGADAQRDGADSRVAVARDARGLARVARRDPAAARVKGGSRGHAAARGENAIAFKAADARRRRGGAAHV
mmetsp:Transcript_19279/g.68532  ORF Transcript_19279/g.68532 Transcript_19279/m.68532 type:complete len:330 (+) Transcript_19279:459-1448(+)